MTLAIECTECKSVVAELADVQSVRHFGQVLAIACHATSPHYTHRLRVLIDGADVADCFAHTQHELRFTCLDKACADRPDSERVSVYHVPRWLAGAVALAHHSGHEGHRFSLAVDGVTVL